MKAPPVPPPESDPGVNVTYYPWWLMVVNVVITVTAGSLPLVLVLWS